MYMMYVYSLTCHDRFDRTLTVAVDVEGLIVQSAGAFEATVQVKQRPVAVLDVPVEL